MPFMHRSIAVVNRGAIAVILPGSLSLFLDAVNSAVVPRQGQAPLRADEEFIAGWMDGVDAVGVLGQLSVHAGVSHHSAVLDVVVDQISLCNPAGVPNHKAWALSSSGPSRTMVLTSAGLPVVPSGRLRTPSTSVGMGVLSGV